MIDPLVVLDDERTTNGIDRMRGKKIDNEAGEAKRMDDRMGRW